MRDWLKQCRGALVSPHPQISRFTAASSFGHWIVRAFDCCYYIDIVLFPTLEGGPGAALLRVLALPLGTREAQGSVPIGIFKAGALAPRSD